MTDRLSGASYWMTGVASFQSEITKTTNMHVDKTKGEQIVAVAPNRLDIWYIQFIDEME